MTLQQLHYAIAISEAGSLSKAAESLYVSQPSLTGSMQELEKELGIQIFNRSGRGMSLTNDGAEFLLYARQVYSQYEVLQERFGKGEALKKQFCVSAQHYSFAVKAFVEMMRRLRLPEYDFAIRETRTKEVIDDVAALRSEVGILYLSDFNRAVITKLLRANHLTFTPLADCKATVYLWKDHPLAGRRSIASGDLAPYPCLTFEQDGSGSFYFAEEVFGVATHSQTVRVRDRSTMLNLMEGLNGYTVCPGIICEELNGADCVAVPFDEDDPSGAETMQVGYIVRKDGMLSGMGKRYVRELKAYLAMGQNG